MNKVSRVPFSSKTLRNHIFCDLGNWRSFNLTLYLLKSCIPNSGKKMKLISYGKRVHQQELVFGLYIVSPLVRVYELPKWLLSLINEWQLQRYRLEILRLSAVVLYWRQAWIQSQANINRIRKRNLYNLGINFRYNRDCEIPGDNEGHLNSTTSFSI